MKKSVGRIEKIGWASLGRQPTRFSEQGAATPPGGRAANPPGFRNRGRLVGGLPTQMRLPFVGAPGFPRGS